MKKRLIAIAKLSALSLVLVTMLANVTTANAESRHTGKKQGVSIRRVMVTSDAERSYKVIRSATKPQAKKSPASKKNHTRLVKTRVVKGGQAPKSAVKMAHKSSHATSRSNAGKTTLAASKKAPARARQLAMQSRGQHQAIRSAPAMLAPASASARATDPVRLNSSSAMVVDAVTGQTVYAKNANQLMSIASITKLMTAMVALDAHLPMHDTLTISEADVDYLKHTNSRLPIGTRLSRYDALHLALMSSENRASSALSRHYPGGKPAFINAMRMKAAKLGMLNTRFNDPTGLTPTNVSTAEDLVKLVKAASKYNLIHEFTTTAERDMAVNSVRHLLEYRNTNRLVRGGEWDIDVSKTGYIKEAGHCLVMQVNVKQRPTVMVLLESAGKLSPVGDATRLKNWMEAGGGANMRLASR